MLFPEPSSLADLVAERASLTPACLLMNGRVSLASEDLSAFSTRQWNGVVLNAIFVVLAYGLRLTLSTLSWSLVRLNKD
jgi:alpha-D-ribose 1-methylphosphonate 5-triphosphate synthase subunit PhnI